MDDDLDMGAMVDEVSEGLGFGGKGDDAGTGGSGTELGTGGTAAPAPAGDAGARGDAGAAAKPGTGEAQPTTKPAVAGDGTAAPKPADGTGQPAPIPAAPGPDAAPKTWTPGAAEKWATLDPVIKAEINKREQDMFNGLEMYKEDASWGKGIKGLLAPYIPIMQQHKIDPMQQVGRLMNAHYTLATGSPEERGQLLGQLLVDYKIDPQHVPLPGAEPPYVDPEVKALRERTQALESAEQQRIAASVEASKAEQNAKIERFFADPKNVYVGQVGHDMARLIETGVAKDLEDAYTQAIWLNPVTRVAEVNRQAAEAAGAARKADAEKAEAARKASSANVRAKAKSGSTAAPLGTMDDTMMATLAAIKARDGGS